MIFSAQSVLFLTISTGVIPPAIPSRPKPFECLDGRIVPINTNRHTAGLLQTSGFPHRLKLPLKCAWLIDNSARDARQSKNYLHLYFTQFYLSPGFVRVSGHKTVQSARRHAKAFHSLNSTTAEILSENWQFTAEGEHLALDDNYAVISVNIPREEMHRVHLRSLEVYDSQGFRLAFERSRSCEKRRNSCSLLECSLNGVCRVNFEFKKSGQRIRDFECSCRPPNREEVIGKAFSGPNCGSHRDLDDCGRLKNCSDRGFCRYLSSRHTMCQCESGFRGKICQEQVTRSPFDEVDVVDGGDDDDVIDVDSNDVRLLTGVNSLGCGSKLTKPEEQSSRRRTDEEDEPRDTNHGNQCPDEFFVIAEEKDQVRQTAKDVSRLLAANFTDAKVYISKDESIHSIYVHSKRNVTEIAAQVTERLNLTTGRPGSRFCMRGLRVKSKERPLLKGGEFYLSCSVKTVGQKVNFKWLKDGDFEIKPHLAERSMRVDNHVLGGASDEVLSVLAVRKAVYEDDGIFTCQVVDTELASLRRIDGPENEIPPFGFSGSQSLELEVLRPPLIEVYPRSLTLFKSSKRNNAGDVYGRQRALHCLCDKRSSALAAAKHYSFQWRKNGRNVEEEKESKNGAEIVEEVWLPDKGNAILRYGLILRLGDIEESANYTCVVKDSRAGNDHDVSSQVEVRVFVADRYPYDVCDTDDENSMYRWPITVKGQEAVRSCAYEKEGVVKRKCEPSNVNSRGTWSHWLDKSGCINQQVSKQRENLELFMSGYISKERKIDEDFAVKFFRRIFDDLHLRDGYSLAPQEWKIVRNMTERILSYYNRRRGQRRRFAADDEFFFQKFIDWLLDSVGKFGKTSPDIHQSAVPFFELFELVKSGASLFSSQLPIDTDKIITDNNDDDDDDERDFCNNGIYLKLAKLSPPPPHDEKGREVKLDWRAAERRMRDTEIATYRTKTNAIKDNKESREDETVCSEKKPPSVKVRVFHRHLKQGNSGVSPNYESVNVAIIHYGPLDSALTTAHVQQGNRVYNRTSSVVTILVEPGISSSNQHKQFSQGNQPKDQFSTSISIQFDAFKVAKNDSLLSDLVCGSLNISDNLDIYSQVQWKFPAEGCELKWHEDGLVCHCEQSGTYALLWWKSLEKETSANEDRPHIIITLTCGCVLTMTVLSIVSLLAQLRNGVEAKISHWIQIAFCLSIGLVMSIIALASLNVIFRWTSPVIQIGFISAIWFKLWSLFEIRFRMGMTKHVRALRTLFTLLTAMCPLIYVAYLLDVSRSSKADAAAAAAEASFADGSWFVRIDGDGFRPFVAVSSILVFAVYSFVLVLFVKVGKESGMKNSYLGRNLKFELKRCLLIVLLLLCFIVSCATYSNRNKKGSLPMDILLCGSSLTLGLAIFLGFFLSHDGFNRLAKDDSEKSSLRSSSTCKQSQGSSSEIERRSLLSKTRNHDLFGEDSIPSHRSIDFIDGPIIRKNHRPFNVSNETSAGSSSGGGGGIYNLRRVFGGSSGGSGDSYHSYMRRFGRPRSATNKPLPQPVNAVCFMRASSPDSKPKKMCQAEVHRSNNEPLHITEIVQKAQDEFAVDFIKQISDGTLSRNIEQIQRSSSSSSSDSNRSTKKKTEPEPCNYMEMSVFEKKGKLIEEDESSSSSPFILNSNNDESTMTTDSLLAAARDKVAQRPRMTSTGDSAPSSEQDSVGGGEENNPHPPTPISTTTVSSTPPTIHRRLTKRKKCSLQNSNHRSSSAPRSESRPTMPNVKSLPSMNNAAF